MRIYNLFLTLDYACLLMEWSWREVDNSVKGANFKQRTWVSSEKSRSIKGLEVCAGFLTCPPYSSFLTSLPWEARSVTALLNLDGTVTALTNGEPYDFQSEIRRGHASCLRPSKDSHSGRSSPLCQKFNYPETSMQRGQVWVLVDSLSWAPNSINCNLESEPSSKPSSVYPQL